MTEWVNVTNPKLTAKDAEPRIRRVTRSAYENVWKHSGFVLCDADGKAVADPEALKGDDLDKALDVADLPKTGTADDKRQRLAEHNQQTG